MMAGAQLLVVAPSAEIAEERFSRGDVGRSCSSRSWVVLEEGLWLIPHWPKLYGREETRADLTSDAQENLGRNRGNGVANCLNAAF
jgi:hypothetical protein